VVPVDNDLSELELTGDVPEGALVADAGDLPFDTGSIDGVFCSNLLEHTPDADAVIREIERVLRPGGWGYISWTNWYSPWGGHDMTPYQYLGPKLGPRAYVRRHGPPRKNAYGEGLWAQHIGRTLKLVRARPGLEITCVEPRYWPQLRFIVKIPVLREVFTWNCVIRVRKRGDADEYKPAGKLRRIVDLIRDDGLVSTVAALSRWGLGYVTGRARPGRPGTFEVDGRRYEYLHHPYRWTWLTERAPEVPLMKEVLDRHAGQRILEVGNVMSHYFETSHEVVDKYETGPNIRQLDVLDIESEEGYDLILVISTFEHVGWDEEPRRPQAAVEAVEHLRGLLRPGGKLVATIPVNYHPGLDAALREGRIPGAKLTALRREERANVWRQVDPATVWDSKYDWLLYTAHGLVIFTLEADSAA
jgi:SAM-dependent methyltransferase